MVLDVLRWIGYGIISYFILMQTYLIFLGLTSAVAMRRSHHLNRFGRVSDMLSSQTSPPVSIVIPAYNEAARLPETLARLDAYFAGREPEIVVVDDGSTDGTAELARRGVPGRTPPTVIAFPENRGKGAAVRAGVAASTGETVLYMDADLATDIADLDGFLKLLEDYDVVVGSRAVPGATVHNTTRLRTVMGRTFNRMARMLTRLEVHDSQCGYKAFRGDAGRFALHHVQEDIQVVDLAEQILHLLETVVPIGRARWQHAFDRAAEALH
jgi:glycosyltransferase involved in cell wall biosynthesis